MDDVAQGRRGMLASVAAGVGLSPLIAKAAEGPGKDYDPGLPVRSPKSAPFDILVRDGQSVEAGDHLFQFDTAEEDIQLAQLASSVSAVENYHSLLVEGGAQSKSLKELIDSIQVSADDQAKPARLSAIKAAGDARIGAQLELVKEQSALSYQAAQLRQRQAVIEGGATEQAVQDAGQACKALLSYFELVRESLNSQRQRLTVLAPTSARITLRQSDTRIALAGSVLAFLKLH